MPQRPWEGADGLAILVLLHPGMPEAQQVADLVRHRHVVAARATAGLHTGTVVHGEYGARAGVAEIAERGRATAVCQAAQVIRTFVETIHQHHQVGTAGHALEVDVLEHPLALGHRVEHRGKPRGPGVVHLAVSGDAEGDADAGGGVHVIGFLHQLVQILNGVAGAGIGDKARRVDQQKIDLGIRAFLWSGAGAIEVGAEDVLVEIADAVVVGVLESVVHGGDEGGVIRSVQHDAAGDRGRGLRSGAHAVGDTEFGAGGQIFHRAMHFLEGAIAVLNVLERAADTAVQIFGLIENVLDFQGFAIDH